VALGVFWGTWAVLVTDVKAAFHLNNAALGALLAVAVGVAAVTSAAAGHRAERWGTRRMLSVALAAWALLLVGAGVARTWPVFAVIFAAAEVAGGCVDTAMNAAASRRLAYRPGALVRFHSLFNCGALAGAAAAGIVLGLGGSWRWLWPTLAVVVAVLAVFVARREEDRAPTLTGAERTRPDGRPPAPTPQPSGVTGQLRVLRADRLLLFLAVFAIAEITEGGVDTWGVLYLRTELAAGVLLGAGAYVVGQSVAALTRGLGGPVLGRLPVRLALVVGGLVASAGIMLEAHSPVALIAACGLALGAGGASLFWPLVMSQITQQASQPTSAAGAFTAAGYVGWVAGAPLVGWVSDTWGLARGLELLGVLALAVAAAGAAHGWRRRHARAPD
jgi:MFS family permease